MKVYFKILLINVLILAAFDSVALGFNYFGFGDIAGEFILSGIFFTTMTGVVLPCIWQDTLKKKLLTIFLMPTNYIIFLFILYMGMMACMLVKGLIGFFEFAKAIS